MDIILLQKKKKPAVKKRKKTKRVVVDEKTGKTKEIDVEVDDFVYEWVPCICGMSHPPIPDLDPPKGKRCFYYWVRLIVLTSFVFLLSPDRKAQVI